MAPKRKPADDASDSPPAKKAATAINTAAHSDSRIEERVGIVQREFYPPEMSNERCKKYINNEIPRPIEVLTHAIEATAMARKKIAVGDAVVHWFKRDLRTKDNRALSLANDKAKSKGVPLICMFIVSPQDYQAHLTSAVRVDFELRTLEVIKQDLAEKGIPLFVETIEKRKTIPARILELCKKWGAKHIFCNMEYEVDELRREANLTEMCLGNGIDFTTVHDDVVVPPGAIATQGGKQFSVYTPWFRAWVAHLHKHVDMLSEFPAPVENPKSARDKFKEIFEMEIPRAPANKTLTDEERKRFSHLWPAGEHEAEERLEKFLSQRISKYKDARNLPASNSTAVLSVHFSTGTLAARTAVRHARDSNSTQKLDGGNEGIKCWISEVAWRDFYKHVMAHWPFVW